MFEEYQPYLIRKFKGLWDRGTNDSCPPDHFQDCLNMQFTDNGVKTRDGLEQTLASGNVLRTHSYKRIGEASRDLILKAGGNLYDSTNLGVPILTIAAMTDFSAINVYNRIYISPHNGIKGLPGEKVYVWDGTTIRAAAGIAPTGAFTAVNSATTGIVEAGTHLFAVVYETASGFLTKPGPVTFPFVVADGTKKVDLSIPNGPAGTVRKHVIATRAIADYNGNQFGQEWFFVPNGTIHNNSDLPLTVNFYDSELSADALYLFYILTELPSCLVLFTYKGRLGMANFDENQFLVRLSTKNEPEVFDEADSAMIIGPEDGLGITNAVEHRDLLGFTKSLMSYVTSDNGDSPNTWDPISLDPGIGTEVHGISSILDKSGTSTDVFFIASRGGLILFNGSFQVPELSWKIEALWKRINQANFHKVQVAYDSINKYIYVLVPLDAATDPSHILFADCSDGLDYKKIQWSPWAFPFAPTSILIDTVSKSPILKIAGDNIYKQTVGLINDNGTVITNYVKMGLAPDKSNGVINHFNAFIVRMIGSGSVEVELTGLDNSVITHPPNFNVTATPGKEILRKVNYVAEKMAIKFSMTSINETFELSSLIIYFKALWSQRPQ